MIVHKVSYKGFMGLKAGTLDLPDTGLIVVSGFNGSGKTSRFITAPGYAVWGQTERGTPPVPKDEKAKLELYIEATIKGKRVSVARTQVGSKKDMHFEVDGVPSQTHSTPTKAQAALDAIAGDFMTWRRSHVFSSADAASFSIADDATRKRLLESMLALDIFDEPLAVARERARGVKQTLERAQLQLDRAFSERKLIVQQALEVKALIGDDTGDMDAMQEELAALDAKRKKYQTKQREVQQAIATANAALARAQADLRAVGDGTCRTCGQTLPHADVGKHEAAAQAAREEADKVRADTAELQAKIVDGLDKLQVMITTTQTNMSHGRKAQQAAVLLEKYRVQATTLKTTMVDLQGQIGEAQYETEVLEHTIRVFSTKGVRAMLLGRALSSLTTLANAYLERLRPGVSIELLPTSETKSGKVTDTIALNVIGLGGGWGYPAASGGERKRIDIALLLALSSLASSKGTLIFDEAMDAVDAKGVEAVSSLLLDVATERAVVIISHNTALVDSLSGATRHRF